MKYQNINSVSALGENLSGKHSPTRKKLTSRVLSLRLPNSNHGSSHCVFDRAWKGMENEQLSREGGPEKWRLEEKPFLLKWFPFLRGHVYFQVTFLLFQVIVTRFVKEKGLQQKTVYFFLRPLKSLPLRLISLNLIFVALRPEPTLTYMISSVYNSSSLTNTNSPGN